MIASFLNYINCKMLEIMSLIKDKIKKREYVMKFNKILKQKTQSSHREEFYAQLLRNEVN